MEKIDRWVNHSPNLPMSEYMLPQEYATLFLQLIYTLEYIISIIGYISQILSRDRYTCSTRIYWILLLPNPIISIPTYRLVVLLKLLGARS